MSSLSSSYAKWDAMDVSDDEEQRWQPPRDIDVPLNITDDDLATPQFASTVSTTELASVVPSPLFAPPVVVDAVAAEPPPVGGGA